MKTVKTVEDVFNHFGADYDETKALEENNRWLSRRIYKDTGCGAWGLVQLHRGQLQFHCGSIVEGTDAEVSARPVQLPCTPEELDAAIQYVEDEVQVVWDATHGCDGCEKLCEEQYGKGGWDGQVMTDCPECDGDGVAL